MFDDSIIKKTNQWLKACIAFWSILIGGTIIFIGLANMDKKEFAITLLAIGMLTGISGFIYGCLAIRCPNCNAPWVWLGVSGKSTNEWLHWLLSQSKCSKCDEKNT